MALQQQPPLPPNTPPTPTAGESALGVGITPPLLPLFYLKRGNLVYLLYQGALIAGAVFGLQFVHNFVAQRIVLLSEEFHLSLAAMSHIRLLVAMVIWAVIVPITLTAVVLPLRIIFLNGRLSIDLLFQETIPALQISVATSYLVLRRSVRYLFPAVAMYVLYHSWVVHQKSPSVYQIYTAACILVGAVALWKVVALLCAPIAGICGLIQPNQAVSGCHDIYAKLTLTLLVIIGGGIVLSVGILKILHGIPFQPSEITLAELCGYGFIAWYVIAGIATLTLRRLLEIQGQFNLR